MGNMCDEQELNQHLAGHWCFGRYESTVMKKSCFIMQSLVSCGYFGLVISGRLLWSWSHWMACMYLKYIICMV